MTPVPFQRFSVILIAAAFALFLGGCGTTGGLAPGLVARMDAPDAKLDTITALDLINQLRVSRGTPVLARDPELETMAQTAAAAYAASNKSPQKPDAAASLLTGAGYTTFAETFSGWRGSRANTDTLSDAEMRRAGLAVSYNGASESGTYWVLLLAP